MNLKGLPKQKILGSFFNTQYENCSPKELARRERYNDALSIRLDKQCEEARRQEEKRNKQLAHFLFQEEKRAEKYEAQRTKVALQKLAIYTFLEMDVSDDEYDNIKSEKAGRSLSFP